MVFRNGCLQPDRDYNPPITFVVVQKRYPTRLSPDSLRDEVICGCYEKEFRIIWFNFLFLYPVRSRKKRSARKCSG